MIGDQHVETARVAGEPIERLLAVAHALDGDALPHQRRHENPRRDGVVVDAKTTATVGAAGGLWTHAGHVERGRRAMQRAGRTRATPVFTLAVE